LVPMNLINLGNQGKSLIAGSLYFLKVK